MYTTRPYYIYFYWIDCFTLVLYCGCPGCRFVLMHRVFIIANKPSLQIFANITKERHLARCVRPIHNTPMADCYVSWFFVPLYQCKALSCNRSRLRRRAFLIFLWFVLLQTNAVECGVWFARRNATVWRPHEHVGRREHNMLIRLKAITLRWRQWICAVRSDAQHSRTSHMCCEVWAGVRSDAQLFTNISVRTEAE